MANAFQRLKQHPRGFWFVFWGELAERASYYGMRAILALYLVDVLHFDQGRSGQTVQFFIAGCYLMTIIGGLIADHFLGKFRTIIYFSVPYIFGHLILGGLNTPFFMYIALMLLALGSGTVKPNISPLMGAIYEREKKTHLLTEAFSYFYAAVNIGAAVSMLSLPLLRDKFGYSIALICPTVLMAAAMAIFYMGKKHYPVEHVGKRPKKTDAQKAEEKAVLVSLAGVFGLIVLFWLVYDQSASTWIFFARDHMNLTLWPLNITISADQAQGLNSLFIIMLTPFFIWLWGYLERLTGKPVPATRKIMLGFVLTTVCMAAMAFAGFLADSTGAKVSGWFIVLATFVITLAELCVSVVGLELAYTVASDQAKSTVTAAFLLTIFGGNFLGGFLSGQYPNMTPGSYFGLQTAIIGVATVLFYFVGKKFERK